MSEDRREDCEPRSPILAYLRCEVCGTEMTQRVEGRPRRFCSSSCRSKARRVGTVQPIRDANEAEMEAARSESMRRDGSRWRFKNSRVLVLHEGISTPGPSNSQLGFKSETAEG